MTAKKHRITTRSLDDIFISESSEHNRVVEETFNGWWKLSGEWVCPIWHKDKDNMIWVSKCFTLVDAGCLGWLRSNIPYQMIAYLSMLYNQIFWTETLDDLDSKIFYDVTSAIFRWSWVTRKQYPLSNDCIIGGTREHSAAFSQILLPPKKEEATITRDSKWTKPDHWMANKTLII